MKIYHDLIEDVIKNGTYNLDRTGTGTFSVFGRQVRFNLQEGFPLLTTKRVHLKSVIYELLWFLKGDTNIKYLNDNGVSIWDDYPPLYTLERDIVLVEKKTFPSIPLITKISLKGMPNEYEFLKKTWTGMMRRCYKKDNHNYKFYGGRGVTVCEDWQDYNIFLKDVQTIPHWKFKKDNPNLFELDKDYYNSNQYNKECCVWLRKDENKLYTENCYPFKLTNNIGDSKIYFSLEKASKENNISKSSLHRWVNKKQSLNVKANNKLFKEWSIEKITETEQQKLRLKLIHNGELGPVYGKQWRSWGNHWGEKIDQISNVIDNIKQDPHSRRHLVIAYNPADIPEIAPPACHTLFQFYVSNGNLSLHLYQRSADLMLGVPFNIASYSLLLMMVAQVTGLKPYEFIHTFGDLHIYTNHIEGVKTQLKREPRPLPHMKLNPEVSSIFDFKYDDFVLSGYNPYAKIKFDISV